MSASWLATSSGQKLSESRYLGFQAPHYFSCNTCLHSQKTTMLLRTGGRKTSQSIEGNFRGTTVLQGMYPRQGGASTHVLGPPRQGPGRWHCLFVLCARVDDGLPPRQQRFSCFVAIFFSSLPPVAARFTDQV